MFVTKCIWSNLVVTKLMTGRAWTIIDFSSTTNYDALCIYSNVVKDTYQKLALLSLSLWGLGLILIDLQRNVINIYIYI